MEKLAAAYPQELTRVGTSVARRMEAGRVTQELWGESLARSFSQLVKEAFCSERQFRGRCFVGSSL